LLGACTAALLGAMYCRIAWAAVLLHLLGACVVHCGASRLIKAGHKGKIGRHEVPEKWQGRSGGMSGVVLHGGQSVAHGQWLSLV
jgi:hypothetical protein